MTTTAVILQSGRFTASPDQLTFALDAHKARLDRRPARDSKVIQLTEMSPTKYDKPLRDWAVDNGWHLFHPVTRGPDECAILTSRPIQHQSYFLLSHMRLDAKVTNRTAPLFVCAVKPRGDDWFAVWHSPAHNDGLTGHSKAKRVYLDALGGLKAWRMGVGGQPTIGGDWNADPNRARIFDTLTRRFQRMEWAGDGQQRPTEGGRVIDGFLTRRPVLHEAKTLPALPGMDHRAVLTLLG